MHKVFISYYHADDQFYKDELQRLSNQVGLFVDWSVNPDDIKDEGLTDDQIRRIIRKEYLKDSTVTIILVGKNTSGRKHVDWEIHGSMSDIGDGIQSGILVVNLPTINQKCRATDRYEQSLIWTYDNCGSLSTRKDFEVAFPICLQG
ncbi:TIR domain-containing protein [Methanimicrococcus sp. OttesenSCG-928-J09]|nr:TIR domain-containing protein [Methanimicrococcus sp. OttesenSCG-928-J09]